jgi:hypothetical protein
MAMFSLFVNDNVAEMFLVEAVTTLQNILLFGESSIYGIKKILQIIIEINKEILCI